MTGHVGAQAQGAPGRTKRLAYAGLAAGGLGVLLVLVMLAVLAHSFSQLSEGLVGRPDFKRISANETGPAAEKAAPVKTARVVTIRHRNRTIKADAPGTSEKAEAVARNDRQDRLPTVAETSVEEKPQQAKAAPAVVGQPVSYALVYDPADLARQSSTVWLTGGLDDDMPGLLAPAVTMVESGQVAALALAIDLDQRFAFAHDPATYGIVTGAVPEAGTRIATESLPVDFARPMPRPQIAADAGTRTVASLAPETPDLPVFADVRPRPRPERPARAVRRDVAATLAYASPEPRETEVDGETSSSIFGKLFRGSDGSELPGPGSRVAVYVIESATVHMPNGEKLEAHSGLAHMQDNPRYVTKKNRGPTPPNLYNLVMRERRFHGVEAIRLLPADGKKKFNRDGLLAHTYMYARGDSSQSNGCVVFKNYDRFLTAFKKGRIKRMIVVRTLDELPTYMAAL
ncbi:DUF2778 domain-containing protein [Rhodobium gokarnense]|uniref:Na+-transporting methylmalonyl-CoA/oxaloacetate decarboxylase gamma subunit n=1 Tax=Rhodobium gokarnense TaxID=364296 RepID=A0ABT3H666_9HYPH|nr:DUF2778 domain-containing protein [Rhodobium gokarnense]MCW2305886.1 Na+-transporting methylmalonyl-CoA/oxaloacetate decarboxylase gamma subunit [Rhodobium gokarnense]